MVRKEEHNVRLEFSLGLRAVDQRLLGRNGEGESYVA